MLDAQKNGAFGRHFYCLCRQDKLVVTFRLGIEHHVRHPIASHANGIGNVFPLNNAAHQL